MRNSTEPQVSSGVSEIESKENSPRMIETQNEARSKLFQRVRSVGLLTFLSRILGLIRDSVMAMQFGNGMILDAFTVAFRLPNLARQLFGEGALSTAFLPVFIRDIEQHDKPKAFQTATSVIVWLSALLFGLVVAAELVLLAIWWLVPLSDDATLLIGLMATMIPYLLLVCVLAQTCAIMHGLGEFSVPAMFPVLLNTLWIIFASIWIAFVDDPLQRIYAISGTIVGIGVIQLVLALLQLKSMGFRFGRNREEGRARIREIAATMLPVVAGLSIAQFNTLLDSLVAWALTQPAEPSTSGWLDNYPLTEGTASALYLGQRMWQFPLGIFGVALGTVIFPLLARHAERNEFDLFRDDLMKGLRLVVAIGIPASAGLWLVAEPLTATLFQRGQFDEADSRLTAAVITMYSTGVWAACGLLILHRAFYALGDRQTPLRIGLGIVVVNVTLNLSLVWNFKGPGLAFATSASAMLQCGIASVVLRRRLGAEGNSRLPSTFIRTMVATTVMVVACRLFDEQLARSWSSLLQLVLMVIVGGIAYFVSARILKLNEPFELLRRRRQSAS